MKSPWNPISDVPWQASIHLPNLLGEEGDVTRLHGTATDEPRLFYVPFLSYRSYSIYSDSPLGKLRKTPKNSSNIFIYIHIYDLLIKLYQYIPTYSHHFHGFHRFFHGFALTLAVPSGPGGGGPLHIRCHLHWHTWQRPWKWKAGWDVGLSENVGYIFPMK